MAKSIAKKQRLKLEREGRRNPETNRRLNDDYANISQHTRTVENKKQYKRREKHKQNRSVYKQDDGSFFMKKTLDILEFYNENE